MASQVMDKGYVRLIDKLGNDLSVVNAARASYAKESHEFGDNDQRLLRFLLREGHMSPLRHAALTFEIYAPLMVARQWWKYAVASSHLEDQSGWNESSRRYITEKTEFYIPSEWRSKPENSKQGSGEPVSQAMSLNLTSVLQHYVQQGEELYEMAMAAGIAPEQARLFLPAYALMVRWRWTVSLAAALHFLQERLGAGAQHEIQIYAGQVERYVGDMFPNTLQAFKER